MSRKPGNGGRRGGGQEKSVLCCVCLCVLCFCVVVVFVLCFCVLLCVFCVFCVFVFYLSDPRPVDPHFQGREINGTSDSRLSNMKISRDKIYEY